MRQVLLLIFLFGAIQTYSQYNDSVHHMVHYGTTGVLNKTNNGNSFIVTNAARFGIRKKSIALNANSSWVYGQAQARKINNDFSSTLDFNVYKGLPRFYYWGLGNFDKSFSLKINSRWQSGLGVAYSFIDKPTAFINISNGLLYEGSDLTINDTIRNVYTTFRNSFRLRYRFVIQEAIIIESMHLWQPSLSYKEDYILKSTNSLSIRLRKWLSFTAAATYNKLNRNKRENLLLTFGVTLEKYF